MKAVCIIPARMKSSRFYGKPIKKILGYPMIEHVYKRVQLAKNVDEIYVATCDREIAEVVEQFGGQVIMTSDKHVRGTDRVAEAALNIEADIILNVQGDEPMMDPESLDQAITIMRAQETIECMNAVSIITDWDVFISCDIVKAVEDIHGNIMYFSRRPVPYCEKENFDKAIKQIGIYLFRKDLLLQYPGWDETPIEKLEKVDMMRFLENGCDIRAIMCKDMVGVDTPAQLRKIEGILRDDMNYKRIFDEHPIYPSV